MNSDSLSIKQILTTELAITQQQVSAFITLYDDGNTVPFIARYRKEATAGLNDIQLRLLESRLIYLREVSARRNVIFKNLIEQNKLSVQLRKQIENCINKSELELLYAPFKNKRISKGAVAIEAGIEPLADKLWFQQDADKNRIAKKYINASKGFNNIEQVLEGALAIIIERISSDTHLLDKLRKHLLNQANFCCKVVKGKEEVGRKFKDYFNYSERINKIASHRFLAILRGKNEGILKLKLEPDPKQDKLVKISYCQVIIANHLGFSLNNLPDQNFRVKAINTVWKKKLLGSLENQLISSLKEKAFDNAIEIFAGNLKDLLMASPAGRKVVLGLDPGFRTGCKVAVIDETGKLLDYTTIYPHAPLLKKQQAETLLLKLLDKYQVDLIAIGNGTASRETEDLAKSCIGKQSRKISQVIVSEAGASVYSASELGSNEFPDLDVSIRGAVSIARRLQDPLAELVKIDAKAIGVGLYQHDLNQTQLSKRLQAVVEDCVNAVGVDLNTASVSLLSFIAGLNTSIAQNIVDYRNNKGAFHTRLTLKKVPRLGEKAFQQCAGFLRIANGNNPLDNSGVHPEAYDLVKNIAKQENYSLNEMIDNTHLSNSINIERFVNQKFGLCSISEILKELSKPRRDPRPVFKTVCFSENINKIDDLYLGLALQGVISNVTSFGAFVDIGVHQDGLVHISQLANKFVSDPLEIVKAGQIVKVKVLEVDLQRNRIALTMRL